MFSPVLLPWLAEALLEMLLEGIAHLAGYALEIFWEWLFQNNRRE